MGEAEPWTQVSLSERLLLRTGSQGCSGFVPPQNCFNKFEDRAGLVRGRRGLTVAPFPGLRKPLLQAVVPVGLLNKGQFLSITVLTVAAASLNNCSYLILRHVDWLR